MVALRFQIRSGATVLNTHERQWNVTQPYKYKKKLSINKLYTGDKSEESHNTNKLQTNYIYLRPFRQIKDQKLVKMNICILMLYRLRWRSVH